MLNYRPLTKMLYSGAGSLALIGFATPSSAQSLSPSDSEIQDSNEIVVTAQRVEQKLQDVPISISVLGSEGLERSTMGVVEALTMVPGMAQADSTGGTKQFTVRGVSSTGDLFAGTSTVGYYLDTVPFGFVRQGFVPDANAYDLNRIEVLRGPQGTLYGVSAVNGVVRVLTAEPNLSDYALKTRATVSSTKAGGEGYRFDGVANLPLIDDKLALRAVISWEDRPGWIDSPTLGKDINDSDNLTLRLKLKAAPTDDLSITGGFWHSQSHWGARAISDRDRTTTIRIRENSRDEYDIFSIAIDYDFGDATLRSATSAMDYGSFANSSATIGAPNPLLQSRFTSKNFSQEVALTSNGSGPFRWSVGGIYRDVRDELAQNIVNTITGQPALPNPRGLGYKDFSESYAVFGELTWLPIDTLELTGGLRYFHDRNQVRQVNNPNNPNAVLIRSGTQFSRVSPRIVVNWKPSSNFSLYASYAEGFRSGFSQSPTALGILPTLASVGPDNLTNFEVGTKLNALDGRLSLEAALFYIDWNGVQQSITIPFPNPAPGAPTQIAALINGESASGFGGEFQLSGRPVDGLNLGITYSQNDLEFDGDVFTLVAGQPLLLASEGSRLVNSPATTASAFVTYESLIGNLKAIFSGSVNYVSPRLARGLVGGVVANNSSQEAWIARASATLESEGGWRTTLFVDNLTDFKGEMTPLAPFSLSPSNDVSGYRIRPRTVGIQFELDI